MGASAEECVEMYVHEILNGKDEFQGILPMIEEFMSLRAYPKDQVNQIRENLQFLNDRSLGKVPTGARWMRDFVQSHPTYEGDSLVNDTI